MSILDRGPDGRWIGNSEALDAWLPILLKRAYYSPLDSALRVAVRYCQSEAASALRRQADQVLDTLTDKDLPTWQIQQVDKWNKKRVVLQRAIRELAAVDHEVTF